MVSRMSAQHSAVHARSHHPVLSFSVSAVFSAICTPLQYSFPPPKVVFRSDDDRRDEVGIPAPPTPFGPLCGVSCSEKPHLGWLFRAGNHI